MTKVEEEIEYTNDDINELAEWFKELTIDQAFFLKDSYTGFLEANAKEMGSDYVQ